MIIGTICINISMPITLFELNKINPNHEGLNFGLLAAVLFPGVALGIIYPYETISYIVLIILCMGVFVILFFIALIKLFCIIISQLTINLISKNICLTVCG